MKKIKIFLTIFISVLLTICIKNNSYAVTGGDLGNRVVNSETGTATSVVCGAHGILEGKSDQEYWKAAEFSIDSEGNLTGKDETNQYDITINNIYTQRLFIVLDNPDIFGDRTQEIFWYLRNRIAETGGEDFGWGGWIGNWDESTPNEENIEVFPEIHEVLVEIDNLGEEKYGFDYSEEYSKIINYNNIMTEVRSNIGEIKTGNVSSYAANPLTKALDGNEKKTTYSVKQYLARGEDMLNRQDYWELESALATDEKPPDEPDNPDNPNNPPDCPGGSGKQEPRPGTVSLSGKVWEDQLAGKSGTNDDRDNGEPGVPGVKVTWKSIYDGSIISTAVTDGNGNYTMTATVNMYDHPYQMDSASYNRINRSYIEFEYDGLIYTTVAFNKSAANGSKGIELSETRTAVDNKFTEVNKNGPSSSGHIVTATTSPTYTAINNLLDNAAKGSATYCLKHCDTAHYIEGVCGSRRKVVVGSHPEERDDDGDGYPDRTEWVDDFDTITENCNGNHCLQSGSVVNSWTISNMNLGLVRKEQPDMSILSDIEKVDVQMRDQLYTYYYGERGILASPDNYTGVKVQYEFKDVKDVYYRPINPSSIAEVTALNTDDLKVYVTYNIKVKNEANSLTAVLHSIVNYYDNRYSLSTRNGANSGWGGTRDVGNGYTASYYTLSTPEEIAPGQYSNVIKLELEISQNTLKGLIDGNEQELRDTSEITAFSTRYGADTICAEHSTAATKGRTGSLYAGLDIDSQPESAVPGNESTYQDDTDTAPYFRIKQDDYKIVTGTVYEDKSTSNNGERLGNGSQDSNEKGVANVKVELYKVNDDGILELAKLYSAEGGTPTAIDAVTFTDANGNYSFGSEENGVRLGVSENNYIIKYTYGNADKGEGYTKLTQNGTKVKIDTTKIDGNEINARNYKSTIITNDTIKGVMQGNGNDKWHLTLQDGVSVAVDDLKERLSIDSLTHSNFTTPVNMSAYSRPFKIQLQYTGSQVSDVGADGGQFEHVSTVFDFGIIERPREDIVINKTVENLKITLANGQVLIDGNPYKDGQKLDYVQALGPKYSEDKPEQATVNNGRQERLLKIEMDSELLQGAKIELLYAITTTNNSEIDYEYEHNYTDIDQGKNYITTNSGANYYYYGNASGLSLIKPSVELVAEYVDPELTVDLNNEINNAWTKVSVENVDTLSTGTVLTRQHLSEDTINAVKDDKYLIFTTTGFSDVERGTSKTINLLATKLLANQEDEYTYENHVEILQLNGKIARTIDSTKNGEQVAKTYVSGTYVPSRSAKTIKDMHQPDDDMITVTITPPTGLSEYTIRYAIVGMVGLVIVVVGIFIIKKRVLGK